MSYLRTSAALRSAILTLSSVFILSSPSAFAAGELVITELHYHPSYEAGVNENNDKADFIELKNIGDANVNVTGYTVDDNAIGTINWIQTQVVPGGFLVIVDLDEKAAFEALHPGVPVGGTFTGGLSGSGERIKILDASSDEVYDLTYWDGKDEPVIPEGEEDRGNWPELPDGDGYTLVPLDSSGKGDPDDYRSWRPSINLYGSPGADEPLPNPLKVVFVNEIRSRDGANTNDAVEVYNPGLVDIDISNWFLSDNLDLPTKFPLAAGSIVPAGGYLVFENLVDFFPPNELSISSKGEEVFLYSGDGVKPTGYVNGYFVNGSGDGVTFGRYVNTDGEEQLPAMVESLGSANGLPFVGPVVISELMYQPSGAGVEFIEIKNITNQAVPLYDPAHTGTNWFVEGVKFKLNGVQPMLAAGEVALIVPNNPSTFRINHGIPTAIQIFGPYSIGIDGASLRDKGEIVALQRPELIDLDQIYIDVDVVEYDNSDPWPTSAAGGGRSLERVDPTLYGNESTNWKSSLELGGSPGVVLNYTGPEIYVNEILAHTDIAFDGKIDAVEFYNPNIDPVDISGWKLSDDRDAPKKYTILSGTVVPAMGYLVIAGDNDDNPNTTPPAGYYGSGGFALSENGESIVLSSADGSGNLTGFQQNIDFSGTDRSVSIGRHIDSQGREAYVPLQSVTMTFNGSANPVGALNSAPLIGPVVISEIRYNPAGVEPEFIELQNTTSSSVALYDPVTTNNRWLFSSGIDFDFNTVGATPSIPANGRIVILPQGTSVAAFRATHSIPLSVTIYGDGFGFTGALSNEGERVVLSKRGTTNPDSSIPIITVDYVDYEVATPWPVLTADGGRSIERIDNSVFGGEATNWKASNVVGGSPGSANSMGTVYEVWELSMFSAAEIDLGNTGPGEDFIGDGFSNLLAYAFGYNPHNSPTPAQLPQVTIVSNSGSDYLALQIRKNKDASDVTVTAEMSTDLISWGGGAIEMSPRFDNGDGTETITIRDPNQVGSSDEVFLRGKVILN